MGFSGLDSMKKAGLFYQSGLKSHSSMSLFRNLPLIGQPGITLNPCCLQITGNTAEQLPGCLPKVVLHELFARPGESLMLLSAGRTGAATLKIRFHAAPPPMRWLLKQI